MKKYGKISMLLFILTSTLITGCSSGGYDSCVKGMVDNGYSVEDAQELCHDVETESQIR